MRAPQEDKLVIVIKGEGGFKPTPQQIIDAIAEYFVALDIYEIAPRLHGATTH
jgi:hypothetical protein